MTFKDFINKKFLEWQLQYGQRKTIDEFARYLGIERGLVSMWMSGKRKPGLKYRDQLIEVLGEDAAEFFGQDPRLSFVNQRWEKVSEALQQKIVEQIQQETEKNEHQRSQSSRKKANAE